MQSQARRWSGSSGGASPASSRALSHCGNALRGRRSGGSAGSSSSRGLIALAEDRRGIGGGRRRRRRPYLFFLSVNMGRVAVVVDCRPWPLCSTFEAASFFGWCIGLDGHAAGERA